MLIEIDVKEEFQLDVCPHITLNAVKDESPVDSYDGIQEFAITCKVCNKTFPFETGWFY